VLSSVWETVSRPPSQCKPSTSLPLGDSITKQGLYIAPLETLLTDHGYSPNMIANEGYGGWTIGLVDAGLAGYLNHPNVNAPNSYILLMVGINDLAVSNPDPLGASLQLGHLITDIRTIAPLAHLVVAQLTPANHYSAAADAAVPLYNQYMVPFVQGAGPKGQPGGYVHAVHARSIALYAGTKQCASKSSGWRSDGPGLVSRDYTRARARRIGVARNWHWRPVGLRLAAATRQSAAGGRWRACGRNNELQRRVRTATSGEHCRRGAGSRKRLPFSVSLLFLEVRVMCAKNCVSLIVVVVLGFLGIGSGPAFADLIASDSFNYAVGNLAGDNGGTGWNGAWDNANPSALVASSGLTYAGVVSPGRRNPTTQRRQLFHLHGGLPNAAWREQREHLDQLPGARRLRYMEQLGWGGAPSC